MNENIFIFYIEYKIMNFIQRKFLLDQGISLGTIRTSFDAICNMLRQIVSLPVL